MPYRTKKVEGIGGESVTPDFAGGNGREGIEHRRFTAAPYQ